MFVDESMLKPITMTTKTRLMLDGFALSITEKYTANPYVDILKDTHHGQEEINPAGGI